MKDRRRAQSTLEYAMVTACLVAALLAMQIYLKRSIQGRLRNAADELGEQYSAITTTSNLTQTITNPIPVTTTGRPRFITVFNSATGRAETREIMEVQRNESTRITVEPGSREETRGLNGEDLFPQR